MLSDIDADEVSYPLDREAAEYLMGMTWDNGLRDHRYFTLDEVLDAVIKKLMRNEED